MMEEQRRCVDCGRLVNRMDESLADCLWLRYRMFYEFKKRSGKQVPKQVRLEVRCPDCARKIYTTFWR